MKLGVLYDFRNPPQNQWFTSWPEFYAGAFAHMQEMERLGFDAISLCEHHGDPDGYNPGIAVTMTAAAMRTQRVRLCSNIIQLPFYHPVLLAEQLAVLDILSNGRLDVGIGQVGQMGVVLSPRIQRRRGRNIARGRLPAFTTSVRAFIRTAH
jgi:alkanesulfonate monooxygenase SsuD/methylene tetrahydromethanopterin reductase-like flavin-dependent oxidoreductase (luciferase family)